MLLLIQPEYPPSVGGMQTHAVALANRLHQRGHQIVVATYARNEGAAAAAAYDASQPYPTLRCLSRLSYWASVRALLSLVDRFQPELIYGSTPFYGLLRSISGVPVVCRSVGNDVMRCWIPYPYRFASGLLARPGVEDRLEALYRRLRAPGWLEDVFLRSRRRLVERAALDASAIIANSEYTMARLLEMGVSKSAISVVAGGVDAHRFGGGRPAGRGGTARSRHDGPALLTVCRLVAKKGVDLLLEATALARRELPGLSLTVVGDGPEREKCRRIADGLGLNGSVRFVGRVPHDQVAEYYRAADCFVLASRIHRRRNGWADVETMGRVICEANASGVPVVATETGGVPALVSHERNGLLVPPDDPPALASAVVRIWRQPELGGSLAREGKRRARTEFDWEVVTSAYERVFESVLK